MRRAMALGELPGDMCAMRRRRSRYSSMEVRCVGDMMMMMVMCV